MRIVGSILAVMLLVSACANASDEETGIHAKNVKDYRNDSQYRTD